MESWKTGFDAIDDVYERIVDVVGVPERVVNRFDWKTRTVIIEFYPVDNSRLGGLSCYRSIVGVCKLDVDPGRRVVIAVVSLDRKAPSSAPDPEPEPATSGEIAEKIERCYADLDGYKEQYVRAVAQETPIVYGIESVVPSEAWPQLQKRLYYQRQYAEQATDGTVNTRVVALETATLSYKQLLNGLVDTE